MNSSALRVVPLDKRHDRRRFRSGSPPLDQYFVKQVTQDVRRRVTACFVAVRNDDQVAGFYTLSASSVPLALLPADLSKKLPLYPRVPVARMGRLAVDAKFHGQGVGGTLLVDALTRALRSEIAMFAVLVDAKDEVAASFYRYHGFLPLQNRPLQLYFPLAEFAREIAAGAR